MPPDLENEGVVTFRYTRDGGDAGYVESVESWADVLINALDRDHWIEHPTGKPAERIFERESAVTGVERFELRWKESDQ